MSNVTMRRTDWALLVLLGVLWGASFFFSKVVLAWLPPLTLVFARMGIAAAALGLYLRASGESLPRGRVVWAAFFGMGLLNNVVPQSLLFWGQTLIPSGLASILNATTPVFSILLAHWLTSDEKLNAAKMVGVALGLGGVMVLIGPRLLVGADASVPGMLACLAAALSYGLAGVFGRRFRRMGVVPRVGAFGQVAASTVMMLPFAILIDQPWTLPPPGLVTLAALLALGLASTALAYVIYFHILAAGGATNASLVTLLVPVSAILLGSLVLGERLGMGDFAGMALIGLGLVAIDGRAWRRLTRGAPTGSQAVNLR